MNALLLALSLTQWLPRMPSPGTGSFASVPPAMTTAAMTLYVDPTGTDAGACTSTGTGACLTIQGAVNKVPKRVRHAVTINVASGTYASGGAYIEGYSYESGVSPTTSAYLEISCALANSSNLATGSATGTATAGAAGSTSGAKGTITDGAAAWTVNDLTGRFVTITSGTGSGQTRLINSNTATVVTITATWATAPNGTSVYAIQDSASTISGSLNLPSSRTITEFQSATVGGQFLTYAPFIIANNRGTSSQTRANTIDDGFSSQTAHGLIIENCKVTTSRMAVSKYSDAVVFMHNQVTAGTPDANGGVFGVYNSHNMTLLENAITMTAANLLAVSVHNLQGINGFLGTRGNLITGGCYVGGPDGASARDGFFLMDQLASMNCARGAISMAGALGGATLIQNVTVTANSSGPCVQIGGNVPLTSSANSLGGVGGYVSFIAGNYSNCTGAGIVVGGYVHASTDIAAVAGTGNTTFGFSLKQGARLSAASSPSITGTTGDLSLDDTNVITWAQVTANTMITRAATNSSVSIAAQP